MAARVASARSASKRRDEAGPDASRLLAWYDRNRRRLPWRAEPGEEADPYRVFLSEIMLQQTTVAAVRPYFAAFLERWPNIASLAAAPLDAILSAWAGLGYYARARNLHACAQAIVARHGGRFPEDEATLLTLPGIGPYTAAAIASIAFGHKATPVDGNWERVVARLFAVDEPMPNVKPLLRRLAAGLTPDRRPGDFAQAMMDLGATLCTPRNPSCLICPWTADCAAHAEGSPERYPVKAAKSVRPTRRGIAFVALRADDAVLVRSRPPKGLLGGMSEVPSTPWEAGLPDDAAAHAPLAAEWHMRCGTVTHVFSHFALELDVRRADFPLGTPAPTGHRWIGAGDLDKEALPSVMRKVLARGLAS